MDSVESAIRAAKDKLAGFEKIEVANGSAPHRLLPPGAQLSTIRSCLTAGLTAFHDGRTKVGLECIAEAVVMVDELSEFLKGKGGQHG